MAVRCIGVVLVCLLVAHRLAAQDGQVPVESGTPGKTLYAPPESESFDFVVLGDRTGGPAVGIRVLEKGVEMIGHLDPDFVMTVGDLIQGYNTLDGWMPQMEEFHQVMGDLAMPWYPVAGNHDVYSRPSKPGGHEEAYKEHFGPLYYSFDHRWAHFVILFSDEKGSFGNPKVDQNMSDGQLAWLREDLASSRERGNTEMTFVFIHHPRWLPKYAESNWDEVNGLFVEDGRPTTIFAGHIHKYRDDEAVGNVKYFTMAVTGGAQGSLRDTAAGHHINLVRVRREGYKMSYMPVGSILGGDAVLGSEVDEMTTLMRGGWVKLEGAAKIAENAGARSIFAVQISNPTDRPLAFGAVIEGPGSWRLSEGVVEGTLAVGESRRVEIECVAPALSGEQVALSVRAILDYALKSGMVQSIPVRLNVPVEIEGIDERAAATPDSNGVLELDGKSALRVGVTEQLNSYTLECWVQGNEPVGRAGLIAKTEGAAYGIFWSDERNGATNPRALTGTRNGYLRHEPDLAWDWDEWKHIALTFDGKVSRMFVAGKMVSEATGNSAASHNRHPLYIGADPDRNGKATDFFTGSIDEVRLSRVARYDGAFTPARVFERDSETVMLLHMDQIVGGVYPDESGAGNHGWPVGEPRIERDDRR